MAGLLSLLGQLDAPRRTDGRRSWRASLQQAVGPMLGMAYVNPTNRSLRVRTSFTVS
jgi:hypothetical protein